MAEMLKLSVEGREERGKGDMRKMRRAGFVPGVYYNREGANIAVKAAQLPLTKLFHQVGTSRVFELEMNASGKTENLLALIWQVQHDPVKSTLSHVDFFGVDKDRAIKIHVPVQVVGQSKGVKLGGVLEIIRETLEVQCKPLNIPDHIVLDITELEINDSIHIGDITFPEGVLGVFDPEDNFAVLRVAPKAAETEIVTGEAAAEAAPADEAAE